MNLKKASSKKSSKSNKNRISKERIDFSDLELMRNFIRSLFREYDLNPYFLDENNKIKSNYYKYTSKLHSIFNNQHKKINVNKNNQVNKALVKVDNKGSNTDNKKYQIITDIYDYPTNYFLEIYKNASYTIDNLIFYIISMYTLNHFNNLYINEHYLFTKEEFIDYCIIYTDNLITSNILQFNLDDTRKDQKADNITFEETDIDKCNRFLSNTSFEREFLEFLDSGIIDIATEEDIENFKGNNNQINNIEYYKLSNDVLKEVDNFDSEIRNKESNYLTGSSLEQLRDMVIFFYHTTNYLSVPGYFLAHTITSYIDNIYNTNAADTYSPKNDIFIFRDNKIQNTLDNNEIWIILEAISKKKEIKYDYINKKSVTSNNTIYPVKIIIEDEYGRVYCYGKTDNHSQYASFRVDRASNIKITENINPDLEMYTNFNRYFRNRWSISSNGKKRLVKIDFYFPSEDTEYRYYRDRVLKNTMRFGNIVELGSNSENSPDHFKDSKHIAFTIEVADYEEMIPWIQSFGKYAIVNKNENPELYNLIKNENLELARKYGII